MKKITISILAISIFSVVNLYFSYHSKDTVNWLLSGVFYVVSVLSILLFILFIVIKHIKSAITVLVIGFLIVVPYNMFLLHEFDKLKSEGDKIVHLMHQQKLETNTFPKSLNFIHDSRIVYTKVSEDDFSLFFWVSNPNVGHFYSSKTGWGYMDD